MPILTLQQRQRELGRIRLGRKGAKGAPTKLDRFRFTSPSRELIEQVAGLYGGQAQPWTPQGGAEQWEVITEATRLPILLPPQPVSQFMELWSGGGCQRRCDGVRELLNDEPCKCPADPEERASLAGQGKACKPTTRLNVVLRDVHGIGVWRLESHGWNAAVELPQVAEFLAAATGQGVYLPAHLGLEERVQKRAGQTQRFMVPTIEVDVSPAALMSGGAAAVGGVQPQALEQPRPRAIEAGSTPDRSESDWLALVQAATTAEELRALWEQAKAANAPGAVAQAITAKVTALQQAASAPAGPSAAVSSDPDELWQQIVARCPVGWSLDDLEERFKEFTSGTAPGAADAEQLQAFLAELQGRVA